MTSSDLARVNIYDSQFYETYINYGVNYMGLAGGA